MSKSDLFIGGQPVSVDNPMPIAGGSGGSSGGLTDTQLRATPVPVSGPLTDAQLRNTAVPVSDTTQQTALGTLTEAAPASDTASSGLNGRLQRIAQRLTSLIGLLPTSLGQGTMAQSLKVAVASDQSAVRVIADASAATGGVLGAKVLSAATTNATVVKATPGRVYGLQLSNTATAYRYFKFYNIATAPVVGTTPVIAIVGVPPGGRASLSSVQGMYFSAGIAYSIVTGAADADATATAAGEVAGSVSYL